MAIERTGDRSEEELNAYWEIKSESLEYDLVAQRCRIISFESRSSGKGRKRRKREVEFLVIDKKNAFTVKNGEVKNKKNGLVGIDVYAMEILSDMPREERTVELLLERAQKVTRTEKDIRRHKSNNL